MTNNAEGLDRIYMTAFGMEAEGAFRCIITPVRRNGFAGVFTLDVSVDVFRRLTTISVQQSVELLHWFLASPPVIPLDPHQQERAR
ncbi:hypothetical protein [Actinopolymorpha alba]|uniref:hypothetical protein n=1 Tax=Actinopolymorpha alba TaxID=533267 RepID=UPI000376AFC7|nr:hypothetical protein [Actinopolymorpha alba]